MYGIISHFKRDVYNKQYQEIVILLRNYTLLNQTLITLYCSNQNILNTIDLTKVNGTQNTSYMFKQKCLPANLTSGEKAMIYSVKTRFL